MDGIFGIGPLELILIAIIALIVLGPERLPTLMREAARYIREIRKLGNELTSQFGDELKVLDELNPRKLINDALDPNHVEKPNAAAPAKPVQPVQPVQPAQPTVVQAAPTPIASATAASNGVAAGPEPTYSILPPASPADAAQATIGQAEVGEAEALVTQTLAVATPAFNGPVASDMPAASPAAAGAPPETPA